MVDPSIIDLLAPLHPMNALQFFIGVFADWAEQEFQKHYGKFDKVDAGMFFLRTLDQELARGIPPDPELARKPRAMVDVHHLALGKERHKIASQLGELSPEDAMRSLAEIITAWTYSIPEDFFDYLPFTLPDYDDKTISNAVANWFTIYFSMFP